jgi:hypothetical protein
LTFIWIGVLWLILPYFWVKCETMIGIMPICIAMETWLIRIRVEGYGLRWIKIIFILMRSITPPTLVFSPLFHWIGCGTIIKIRFDPLGLKGGPTFVGWPCDCWLNGVEKFLGFFLLNPKVIMTHFSTMFISILSNNWNTFAKVGWVGKNNMASRTQHLSSLFMITNQNWIAWAFVTLYVTMINLHICA